MCIQFFNTIPEQKKIQLINRINLLIIHFANKHNYAQ